MDHNKLWKTYEKGIPDHLTCLLRNLYAGQETTGRTEHGTTNWFQFGKGVHKGCILSPCLKTYMQSTSCEMPNWMKHKLESRLLGEISGTSDMQKSPPSWQKLRGTKEPLDESERREWNIWFKLHIQRMKIMAFGPITSWQIMGKQLKQWETVVFWAPTLCQMMTAAMKLKDACFLEEKLWPTYTAY